MNATAMGGIEFVVDKNGRRKAVLINLNRHSSVWEDVYDTLLAQKRRHEPRESLAQVKHHLMASRRRARG